MLVGDVTLRTCSVVAPNPRHVRAEPAHRGTPLADVRPWLVMEFQSDVDQEAKCYAHADRTGHADGRRHAPVLAAGRALRGATARRGAAADHAAGRGAG